MTSGAVLLAQTMRFGQLSADDLLRLSRLNYFVVSAVIVAIWMAALTINSSRSPKMFGNGGGIPQGIHQLSRCSGCSPSSRYSSGRPCARVSRHRLAGWPPRPFAEPVGGAATHRPCQAAWQVLQCRARRREPPVPCDNSPNPSAETPLTASHLVGTLWSRSPGWGRYRPSSSTMVRLPRPSAGAAPTP